MCGQKSSIAEYFPPSLNTATIRPFTANACPCPSGMSPTFATVTKSLISCCFLLRKNLARALNRSLNLIHNRNLHLNPSPARRLPVISPPTTAAPPLSTQPPSVSLADLQALIHKMYFEKDQARGVEGTFLWLMEEIGELATALRSGTHQERLGEFADVLAWLATIANVAGVDLTEAIAKKYGSGCPGCGKFICTCPNSEKP